jgi:AsmA family protein
MWQRTPVAVRWIGAIILGLLLMLVVADLIDWNLLRGPVSRIASSALDRRVRIDGALRVHLLSSEPSVTVEQLTIANPDWAGNGDMIDVQRLQVALQLSQLLRGHLVLQTRDATGRANWDLGKPSPPNAKPTKLPTIRHFALRSGTLMVDDAVRKLTFMGMVIANQSSSANAGEPFRLQGQGTLNQEPFQVTFEGGPLLNIQPNEPYRFQATVDAGPSSARASGSIAKPFDFGMLDVDLTLQGQNLANLYYLTNLALPLTPPYQLSVHLHRDQNHFALDDLAGKIGSSDIRGKAAVDLAVDGRPKLTATLVSRSLNLGDLGVAFGAGVPPQPNTKGAPQLPAPKKTPVSPLLLPTFEFQFDRLKSMDADVDFSAASIQAQKVPFKAVAFKLKLDHGVLSIDPIDFELPLGKLAAQLQLNTNGSTPQTDIDLRIHDVPLNQFRSKTASEQQAPLDGVLQARLKISGHGNSVHAIAADGNGTLSAVVPQGEMREAFAELTGINILRGLGLLLGEKDKSVPIRCGVIEFQITDGNARADRMIVDTQNVLINGDGHIAFNDEKLDLNLQGKPKKLRLGRLRAPINIRGTLRDPRVGISVPAVVKQGAVAAALGAIATPVAAALAFIDPGLAKNANCQALVNEAEDKGAPPTTQPTVTH